MYIYIYIYIFMTGRSIRAGSANSPSFARARMCAQIVLFSSLHEPSARHRNSSSGLRWSPSVLNTGPQPRIPNNGAQLN